MQRAVCNDPYVCSDCGNYYDTPMHELGCAPFKEQNDYWKNEVEDVLQRCHDELAKVLGDGSVKRRAGTKPPWYDE